VCFGGGWLDWVAKTLRLILKADTIKSRVDDNRHCASFWTLFFASGEWNSLPCRADFMEICGSWGVGFARLLAEYSRWWFSWHASCAIAELLGAGFTTRGTQASCASNTSLSKGHTLP